MRNPDSKLTLWMALAIAVVLHAALLPVGAVMLTRTGPTTTPAKLEIEIAATPPEVTAGQIIELAAVIRNVGGSTAMQTTWTSWVVSRDIHFNPDDPALEKVGPTDLAKPRDLGPGGEYRENHDLRFPPDFAGPAFIIVHTEAENAPRVTDTRSIWIDSDQPPRVEVESIDLPGTALAGGTLPVTYTLRNDASAGWAKAGGSDRVILSPDDEVSGDDLVLLRVPRRRPLGPGASSTAGPFEVRIPLGVAPGGYRLIVDSGASAAEPRAMPITIEPATHPDLAPRNIKLSSGEGQLTLGRPTALRFEVVNRSPIPAPDRLWGDRAYWSTDDRVSGDDVLLVSEPRGAYPGPLPGNGRYRSGPHEFVIQSEQVRSSVMYLIVVADDENDVAEGDYEYNNALAIAMEIKQPVEAETPEQLELGRDDEPDRLTVAWIAHDDFQDLLARASVTLQPMLQDRADPTPNAPLERDPQDTGQTASDARPTPPADESADAPTPPAPQVADTARDPLAPDVAGELPSAEAGHVDQVGNATQDRPGLPSRDPSPNEPAAEFPPTVASQEQGDKPTSAPRSDREADPTALVYAQSVRPGRVLTGPGLEVKTFRPDYSAASAFALPHNPKAVITFDLDGTVLQADLLTSTGYENVDSPLLTSLYRWKATGKRLEAFTAPFQIEITILLNGADEPPPSEEDADQP